MCEALGRRPLVPAIFAVVALDAFSPARAAGQTAAEVREQVRRLEVLHAAAEKSAARADSLWTASLDTIRDGVIAVLAARRVAPMAREAVKLVRPLVDSSYGDAALEPIRRPGADGRGSAWLVLADSTLDVATATNRILRHVEWTLFPPLGHAYHAWHGMAAIPPRSAQQFATEMQAAYIELVTAPSPAARSCLLGDLARCRIALGLSPALDPVTEWYDASGRRAVVGQLRQDNSIPGSRRLANQCVDAKSDAACQEVLRGLGPTGMPRPLATKTLETVVRHALHLGGRRAYRRFLASRAPMDVTLAATAGVPADSVLGSWRAALIAHRPLVVTTGRRAAWTAVFWGAVLAVLGLMSARWHRV